MSRALGVDVADITVDQLSALVLRDAFGAFASGHAKASITRCWSTWNQFLTFLVGDGVLPGNPMAAVPRPGGSRQRRSPCRRGHPGDAAALGRAAPA